MIKVSGMRQLETYRRRLAALPKEFPKAEASACNKAAAAVKKLTKAEVIRKTRLPAQPVGRRIHVKRADARKPTRWARVRAYQREFSASYHKGRKGGAQGTPMARQVGKGVTVGRRLFPGAWVGTNKRGRTFVGKRTGKKSYPITYPKVRIGGVIGNAAKLHGDRAGGKILEQEMDRQIEKRIRKVTWGF